MTTTAPMMAPMIICAMVTVAPSFSQVSFLPIIRSAKKIVTATCQSPAFFLGLSVMPPRYQSPPVSLRISLAGTAPAGRGQLSFQPKETLS